MTALGVLLVVVLPVPSLGQQVLFEDHFPLPPGELSQWTIVHGSAVVESPGVVHLGYPVYPGFIRTNASFSYVGTELEFSADMLTPDNGPDYSRTYLNLVYPQFDNRMLAGLTVVGSASGQNPNTASCTIGLKTTGGGYMMEGSGYLPLPNTDGWHNGRVRIRADGRAEFYFDSVWIWTSPDPVFPDYGQGSLMTGGWDNIYDNVLVTTPEPASLSLLALGGLAVLRRKHQ